MSSHDLDQRLRSVQLVPPSSPPRWKCRSFQQGYTHDERTGAVVGQQPFGGFDTPGFCPVIVPDEIGVGENRRSAVPATDSVPYANIQRRCLTTLTCG
jgi:hypothetical protein